MRRKDQAGQEFPAFSQVWCKTEAMGTALALQDGESGIPWISLTSSRLSQTFCCCLSENAVFSSQLSQVKLGSRSSALCQALAQPLAAAVKIDKYTR